MVGYYTRTASGLNHDFQTLTTFGGLFFIRDFHDFYDFRDFWDNFGVENGGLYKKETKIEQKMNKL